LVGWIWILIQKGKNDLQKELKVKNFEVLALLDVPF
jgi:hypothetical protein